MRTNINDENQPQDVTIENSPESVKEGEKEAIKETTKETEKNINKFEKLIESSDTELLRISTVFPFDLFPNQIIIDLNKVNVIRKDFFFTERVHSIYIQDITDVFISTAPFFATLEIIDSGFVENSIKTRFLKIKDAQKARRIIQGLVVAKKQAIDLSAYKDDDSITQKLEKLGETKRT